MALVQMPNFIYCQETAAVDWPLYKQKLMAVLSINRMATTIVARVLDNQGVVTTAGETTMDAHSYVIACAGDKIISINNHELKEKLMSEEQIELNPYDNAEYK